MEDYQAGPIFCDPYICYSIIYDAADVRSTKNGTRLVLTRSCGGHETPQVNQSWYDHLTPGKVKWGDLRYLFLDYCETVQKPFWNKFTDNDCIVVGRRTIPLCNDLEDRLKAQAAIVQR